MSKPRPIGPTTPARVLAAELAKIHPIPTVGRAPWAAAYEGGRRPGAELHNLTERQAQAIAEAVRRLGGAPHA